jgi:hypothetical protein
VSSSTLLLDHAIGMELLNWKVTPSERQDQEEIC